MGQCLCFKWALITSGHFLCRTTCRDCGETLTSFCIWLQFEDAWTLLPCQTRYSTTHLNLPLLLVGNLSATSNTRRPWITELRRHMSHIIILCMFPITSVTVLSTLRLPAAFTVHFQPLISSDHATLLAPVFLRAVATLYLHHARRHEMDWLWEINLCQSQGYDTRQCAFKCCVIFVENVRSLWSTEGNLHLCLA